MVSGLVSGLGSDDGIHGGIAGDPCLGYGERRELEFSVDWRVSGDLRVHRIVLRAAGHATRVDVGMTKAANTGA